MCAELLKKIRVFLVQKARLNVLLKIRVFCINITRINLMRFHEKTNKKASTY
mgnify:CR=1 FL=1